MSIDIKGGIRRLPSMVLKNETIGEVIYTPPSGKEEILSYLDNLEQYINNDYYIDSLIKLIIYKKDLISQERQRLSIYLSIQWPKPLINISKIVENIGKRE